MLELPTTGSDAITTSHEIPELMLFKNAAIAKLDNMMSAPYLDGIKTSKIIQFELAFDGIMSSGKSQNADLIVMGSHGAKGFQEMFIGSNTEKVVRNSEVPVLVIKREEEDFNAEKLDALLNVCLQSRSIICKPTVIQILLEGQLDGLTHDGYSLSGTAIQALGATDLTAVEYDTIKRFILHTPRQSLSAGTLTQSLYFFRKHYDPKEPLGDYFRFIDIALSELQDRQKEDAFTNAIMFELYGAAFYRTQDFFYHFFKWYKNNDMDHWAGEITWLFFQWAQNDPEVGPDFNRTMFEAYMKVEGLTNVEIEKSDIYVSYNTRTLEFKNLQKKTQYLRANSGRKSF